MEQVSGNGILSYTGNAGLAAGANNGAILPEQGNPYAGLQNTLDRINEQQARMNILKYQQHVKDQEDLAQALSETGNSVFNMRGPNGQNMSFQPLPDDQKKLEAKAAEIRKSVLSNTSGFRFDPAYYDKVAEFNRMRNHAGIRSVAYNNYNTAAAGTNDPNERQSIMSTRQAEVLNKDLEEYHQPEPHLPHFTYNPDNFISPKEAANDKNQNVYEVASGKDAAGNLIHTSMAGLSDNMLDFRARVYKDSKNHADAANLATNYLHGIVSDPNAVMEHNRNIDAINRQRGYVDENGNPKSPHYIPHVADVITGPNGETQVRVNTQNPVDIAYSVMAEKYGALQPSKEIKKDAFELQKEAIAEEKTALDMEKTRKQMEGIDADIAEKKAKIANMRKGKSADGKPTEAQVKAENNKLSVLSAYKDLTDVFEKSYAGKQVIKPTYPDYWKRHYGIDPSKYNIYPALSDGVADKFIGVEGEETTNSVTDKQNVKTTTKEKRVSKKPDKVYPLVDLNTGEEKLAFVIGDQAKIVSKKEAVIGALKHDAKYQPSQYESKLPYVDEVLSGVSQTNKATEAPDEESAIRARLRPAKVKKKDGTIVDILIDPVTNKRYAVN